MEREKIIGGNIVNDKKLRAIVIGATGAVGRELVDLLLKSQFYSNVTILVRRKIERWNKLSPEVENKLKIISIESLDILSKAKEELEKVLENDTNYDSLFCCLGSRVKMGDEFNRVDYDYVIYSAELAEKFEIPHFSLISSKGANSKSWFLYMRTKGKADEEVLKRKIPNISIFRPGLIKDRDNDCRFGEMVASVIPFIDKITSIDLAKGILANDIIYHLENKENVNDKRIITHSEIEKLKNKKI